MSNALATFDEPFAWLVRGLVEYGWLDLSRGGQAPASGGFDLTALTQSQGRSGVVLVVPGVVGGHGGPDETYRLVIRLSAAGQFVVRCPECNFMAEYAYDPANPTYTAGYIHQALSEYLPQFVAWRMEGGELTWAQRKGMPEVDGAVCTTQFAAFVASKLAVPGFSFDRGPHEGWWMDAGTAEFMRPEGVGDAPAGAVAWAGEAAEASPQASPKQLVKTPGTALATITGIGIFTGVLWLINAGVTVMLYGADEMFAVGMSIVFFVLMIMAGGISAFGARSYLKVRKSPLVYVSFLYVAFMPTCCMMGIPLAGWAAYVWHQPRVKKRWSRQK